MNLFGALGKKPQEVSWRVTDGRDKKGRSFAPWAKATDSAKGRYPDSMYHMIKCWPRPPLSPIRFSDSGKNPRILMCYFKHFSDRV